MKIRVTYLGTLGIVFLLSNCGLKNIVQQINPQWMAKTKAKFDANPKLAVAKIPFALKTANDSAINFDRAIGPNLAKIGQHAAAAFKEKYPLKSAVYNEAISEVKNSNPSALLTGSELEYEVPAGITEDVIVVISIQGKYSVYTQSNKEPELHCSLEVSMLLVDTKTKKAVATDILYPMGKKFQKWENLSYTLVDTFKTGGKMPDIYFPDNALDGINNEMPTYIDEFIRKAKSGS